MDPLALSLKKKKQHGLATLLHGFAELAAPSQMNLFVHSDSAAELTTWHPAY